MDTVVLHGSDFDSDIDSDSDGPTAIYQEICTGPESSSIPCLESSDYRLSPLLSDRFKLKPLSDYILPIPFEHSVTQLQTKVNTDSMSEAYHATGPEEQEDW